MASKSKGKRLTADDVFRNECTEHSETIKASGYTVKVPGYCDDRTATGLAEFARDNVPAEGVKVSGSKGEIHGEALTVKASAKGEPETVARLILASAGLLTADTSKADDDDKSDASKSRLNGQGVNV